MRVFVTGATGFLGRTLVPRLINDGHEITALVRETSRTDLLPETVETTVGDIRSVESFRDAIGGVDAVVHLATVYTASEDSDADYVSAVNVEGTKNLARAAADAGVGSFVFTATVMAHPDIPTSARSRYEETKQTAAEWLLNSSLSLDSTVLYPTYIFGPRDYECQYLSHFRRVDSNAIVAPPLYTPGRWNFVHVEDVAENVQHALKLTVSVDRQIVSGENLSTHELYSLIAEVSSNDHRVVSLPRSLVRYVGAPVANILHGRGIIPFGGEKVSQEIDYGVVPDQFTNRGFFQTPPPKRIVEDMYEWYRNCGLLGTSAGTLRD